MKRTGSIYIIRNILDGRVYVGSTSRGGHRWSEHCYSLKNDKHHNTHLQRAWNRCGGENFRFVFIEKDIPVDKLLKREAFYIKFFDSCNCSFGYNFEENPEQPIAVGRRPIVQIDPVTCKVVAEMDSIVEAAYRIGKNSRASSNIGRACSDLEKVRISYGYAWAHKVDEEYRIKQLLESDYKSPMVLQYDLVGRFVKVWPCCSDAAKSVGVPTSSIRSACSGFFDSSGGYQWRRFKFGYPTRIDQLKNNNISPVVVFDLSGNRLAEYNSVKEAAEAIGTDHSSVGAVCRNSRQAKTVKGYQCRYLKDAPFGDLQAVTKGSNKQVIQKDDNGSIVAIWETMVLAAKEVGVSPSSISYACSGKISHSAGYRWEYSNGII